MRRILDVDQGFEGDVRFFGVSSVSVVELPGKVRAVQITVLFLHLESRQGDRTASALLCVAVLAGWLRFRRWPGGLRVFFCVVQAQCQW